jgi:hypothetical protein
LHRAALFIGAGLKPHRITGMIVDNRQRMAAAAVGELDPTFEVHLPKLVRRFLLEPLLRSSICLGSNDPTIPLQNRMHD